MMENTRRQGASTLITIIFGILIAGFVINFGPQGGGGGDGSGCRGQDHTILSVDGVEASQSAYKVAYSAQQYVYQRPPSGKQRIYLALEALIRRELLAQEAEDRGLRVTDDLVNSEIIKGKFFYDGLTLRPSMMYEVDESGEKFYRFIPRWISAMNVSKNSYVDEQARSLLATLMQSILEESVQVSREEALSHFLYEGNTASYDVVEFSPNTYRSALRVTDADLDRYVAAHDADVKARYTADERLYKGVKPQLKLREIFIAKLDEPKPEPTPEAPKREAAGSGAGSAAGSAAPAAGSAAGSAAAPKTDAAKTDAPKTDAKKADDKTAKADKKPETKPADKPIGMPIEQAKAKLEAARAAIAAGKQKFADAARELSTEESLKSTGGEIGWRTADNVSLGDKAVSDAVKTLKPGEMTPVITTDRGAYLVIAEDKREGDLSYDMVKRELARDLALDTWSKEAARKAALEALAKAQGKTLGDVFERDTTPRNPFEGMSPEEQQRYIEQLKQQMQQGGLDDQGAIVIESKDQLAAWKADDTTPAAGGSAGSAAAPTAPSAASATGSGSAAAPVAPPEPKVDLMAPVTEQLPALGDVPKPKVKTHGPAPRTGQLPGVGGSKEIATALFEELAPGEVAKRIYESGGTYYVVQLLTRQQPKIEDFDKNADRLVDELRRERATAFVREWLKTRCAKLEKDGKIKPNQGLLVENDDQGKPLPVQYKPCMTF